MARDENQQARRLLKVVYFDEQSASDYLDVAAGGRAETSSEQIKTRTTDMHAEVETKLAARFSWLPFLGASAEVGSGIDLSSAGQSILSKTLSNTILTDYLLQVRGDDGVSRLEGVEVRAPEGSMAHMKMYTPYLVIARTEASGIDLAGLDDAFAAAKGYYELVGRVNGEDKFILRFNLRAFRNNYGLTDLPQMQLIFHGVRVGRTSPSRLGVDAQMSSDKSTPAPTVQELLDGPSIDHDPLLDVYDVLLAGVEGDV